MDDDAAAWGGSPVASIAKRTVILLIDRAHDERGPAAGSKALARDRSFFGWLTGRDVISVSPAVWQAAWGRPKPFGAFVRTPILTGQRRSEIARMTTSEVTAELWENPGARAKNGASHTVPLSTEALAC